ncbi:MAG TPA: 4a-hydroxytetrahydrobiopterin dehydratase [Ktedonobacterales bacterium]
MARLSEDAIQTALGQMPGWSVVDGMLRKTYQFSTFPDGIAFVNRVADLAEEMGHHPDIDIRYSTIIVSLSSHDEGGITERDTTLARRIDGLLAR